MVRPNDFGDECANVRGGLAVLIETNDVGYERADVGGGGTPTLGSDAAPQRALRIGQWSHPPGCLGREALQPLQVTVVAPSGMLGKSAPTVSARSSSIGSASAKAASERSPVTKRVTTAFDRGGAGRVMRAEDSELAAARDGRFESRGREIRISMARLRLP